MSEMRVIARDENSGMTTGGGDCFTSTALGNDRNIGMQRAGGFGHDFSSFGVFGKVGELWHLFARMRRFWRFFFGGGLAILAAFPAVRTEEGLHLGVALKNCQVHCRVAVIAPRIDIRAVGNQKGCHFKKVGFCRIH